MLKKVLEIASIAMLALLVLPALAGAEDAVGKKLFLDSGCTGCHSVTSAGIAAEESDEPPADLSKVGSEQTAEFLDAFLLKNAELKGEKHQKKFRGTDEERKSLVDWLMTLTAPADGEQPAAAAE